MPEKSPKPSSESSEMNIPGMTTNLDYDAMKKMPIAGQEMPEKVKKEMDETKKKLDAFKKTVLKKYPFSTVSIFNRNGTLLYQSTGYSKPWDGTYQGKALPAGTYYYTIDTHTFRSVLAGWVAILK